MAIKPEQELIFTTFAAIRRREEAGMKQLYDDYSGALHHQILKIVNNEETARELLQDVFVRVWNKIDTYDEKTSRPYTWMARIARNRAIDYLRSARVTQEGKTDVLPDLVGSNSRLAVEQFTDHIGLTKVLDQLDNEHRIIIDYLYFQGYSQSEAAEELNIPLGTVKTRSRRAIQQLRTILAKELLVLLLPIMLIGSLLFKILKSFA